MIDDELIKIIDQFEKMYSVSGIVEFQKSEKSSILEASTYNTLIPIEDDIFSEFHLPPSKMNFEIQSIPNPTWDNLLLYTSSIINKIGTGKSIKLAVKETYTNKFVGLIRFGSPFVNCKPRNEILGKSFANCSNLASSFNKKVIMGFVVVPMQPFGYNYLGGKLLAGICCSHEVRQMINKKYGTDICLFETTSLYGTSKTVSQYDGMPLYLKHKGNTESKFVPTPSGKNYEDLKSIVNSIDSSLILKEGTRIKPKSINRIISYVKKNIKDPYQKERFNSIIDKAIGLTEQKRYFVSNYGFKNSIEYITGEDSSLIPGENYDKFYLENIISWWKNKAEKRYINLINQNKLRTEIELQTSDLDTIR